MKQLIALLTLLFISSGIYPAYAAPAAPTAAIVVNSTGDAGDDSLIDAVCETVGGVCTLRAAIEQGNVLGGDVDITFDFPLGSINTIRPQTPFDDLTNTFSINGLTGSFTTCITYIAFGEDTPTGGTEVILDGSLLSSGDGLHILSDDSRLESFSIINFPDDGVDIRGENTSLNCMLIGIDRSESSNTGNGDNGVEVNGNNNVVGAGSTSTSSGNGAAGVEICSGCTDNEVSGIHLGTNIVGDGAIGNDIGLNLLGDDSYIGLLPQFACNNVSSNQLLASGNRVGIRVAGSDNEFECVGVGTSVKSGSGSSTAVPNTDQGVLFVESAENNRMHSGSVRYNGKVGILMLGGRLNTIDFVTVSDNDNHGIAIQDTATSTSNSIRIEGATIRGNQGSGVLVSGDTVTFATIKYSRIYDNTSDGIRVINDASSTIISENSIYDNGGQGIDLGVNGVTANDGPGDNDADLPNFPDLRVAFDNGLLFGTIDGRSNRDHTIEFFEVDVCDGTHGEGKVYLQSLTVAVGASGSADFQVTLTDLDPDTIIAATSTSIEGTSEFSACITLSDTVFIVNTVADDPDVNPNDGECLTASNECSLRAVIETVNAINFDDRLNIDLDIPGFDFDEGDITLTSPLPEVTAPIILNTVANGPFCSREPGSAQPLLTLRGHQLTTGSGLILSPGSFNSIVGGLMLLDFPNSGFIVNADSVGIDCVYSGYDTDGTTITPHPNGRHGVRVLGDGNGLSQIYSGFNGLSGVHFSGGAHRNTLYSFEARNNSGVGVRITGNADENEVRSGEIFGNNSHGILIDAGSDLSELRFLTIGKSGAPNGGDGVRIKDSDGAVLGYVPSFPSNPDPNVIAYNLGAGVVLTGTTQTTAIRYNEIYANGALGIDLNDDGVTPNTQSSSGVNDGQNFPRVTDFDVAAQSISGEMDGEQGTTYQVDFYRNDACDSSGYGEGAQWIGSAEVSTDSIGQGSFSLTPTGSATSFDADDAVSAIATDPEGNSSEFGPCYEESTTPTAVGFAARSEQAAQAVPLALCIFAVLSGLTLVSAKRGFVHHKR